MEKARKIVKEFELHLLESGISGEHSHIQKSRAPSSLNSTCWNLVFQVIEAFTVILLSLSFELHLLESGISGKLGASALVANTSLNSTCWNLVFQVRAHKNLIYSYVRLYHQAVSPFEGLWKIVLPLNCQVSEFPRAVHTPLPG